MQRTSPHQNSLGTFPALPLLPGPPCAVSCFPCPSPGPPASAFFQAGAEHRYLGPKQPVGGRSFLHPSRPCLVILTFPPFSVRVETEPSPREGSQGGADRGAGVPDCEEAGASGSGRQRARRHRDWPRLERGPGDRGRARGARGACRHEARPGATSRLKIRCAQVARWGGPGGSDFWSRTRPGATLQLAASARAPLKPGRASRGDPRLFTCGAGTAQLSRSSERRCRLQHFEFLRRAVHGQLAGPGPRQARPGKHEGVPVRSRRRSPTRAGGGARAKASRPQGKEEGGRSGPGAGWAAAARGTPNRRGTCGCPGAACGNRLPRARSHSSGQGESRTETERRGLLCGFYLDSETERDCERKVVAPWRGQAPAPGVRGVPRGRAECRHPLSRGRRGAVPPPARAEAAGAGPSPPPGSSGATPEQRPPPRPARRGQVAVGARPARLISRGRWRGAEGEGKGADGQSAGLAAVM